MFWRQTPKLFDLAVKGKLRAAETEYSGRAWLAWHIAALPLMKCFPKLSDLQKRPARGERPTQSPAEIRTVMRQWRVTMAAVEDQQDKQPRTRRRKGGGHG